MKEKPRFYECEICHAMVHETQYHAHDLGYLSQMDLGKVPESVKIFIVETLAATDWTGCVMWEPKE